jgi:ribonuclease HII
MLNTQPIIGADEAGWGPLAGPLFVGAAAATPMASNNLCSRDSKKYSDYTKMRRDIHADLQHLSGSIVVSVSANELVQDYGACRAKLFRRAIAALRHKFRPAFPRAIIDGSLDFGVHLSSAYPKADALFPVVSIAACLAKAAQLECMAEWGIKYPEYGFISNAGYGTPDHIDAIKTYGVIPNFHRIPVIAKMARNGGWQMKTRNPND